MTDTHNSHSRLEPAPEGMKGFMVSVEGWQNLRRSYTDGRILMLEVARLACRDNCSRCEDRVQYVTRRMLRSGVAWRLESTRGGLFLVVPASKNETSNLVYGLLGDLLAPRGKGEVCSYLSELLGLRVTAA